MVAVDAGVLAVAFKMGKDEVEADLRAVAEGSPKAPPEIIDALLGGRPLLMPVCDNTHWRCVLAVGV